MSQHKTYDELEHEILGYHEAVTPTAAIPSVSDICTTWARVKGPVESGAQILRLLPMAWARKVADAITQLAAVLNTICAK